MDFLHLIASTPLGIVVSICITGYTAYVAYRKQRNEQEDRLIKILETTVSKLEAQVHEQSRTIEDLSKRVTDFEILNKKYVQMLENRDASTAEFLKRAGESMNTVDRLDTGLSDLVDMLSGHLKMLGCPHGIRDEDTPVVE